MRRYKVLHWWLQHEQGVVAALQMQHSANTVSGPLNVLGIRVYTRVIEKLKTLAQ